MSNELVIYGSGPFAKLMLYHFTHDSEYEVVAFSLDQQYINNNTFCGLPVIAFESISNHYPASDYGMFVAIGYSNMRNRPVMFNKAKDKHYQLVNFISNHAIIRENLILGENNVILSSTDIEPFVTIGNNNVFWTGGILGHNLTIGNHNYISGNCGLGGNCQIGDRCFMGNAAVMVNGLNIADETFMVSGTVILKDTEYAAKYHGNPAKRIGYHRKTGIII